LIDAIDRVLGDARQYITQICFRIDVVQLRRANQAVDRRSTFAAGIRAREEVIAAANGHAAQRALDGQVVDFSRAVVDSSPVRAVGAGQKLARTPPIVRDLGPSIAVTDANGTPLAAILTGANVNDVTQLLPLIDAIPSIRVLRGHPIQRPRVVYADRGYGSERHR
jgi:hypothetical protein